MSGVNKVILIGNLGKDPEVRHPSGGDAMASFSIATNESWTDKSGQRQERTDWHRVVTWGKQAERCGEYLQKGRQVYIEGRLQTREWTDKEGQKKYITEVVARNVTFLSSGQRRDSGGPADDAGLRYEEPPGRGSRAAGDTGGDDDIPF